MPVAPRTVAAAGPEAHAAGPHEHRAGPHAWTGVDMAGTAAALAGPPTQTSANTLLDTTTEAGAAHAGALHGDGGAPDASAAGRHNSSCHGWQHRTPLPGCHRLYCGIASVQPVCRRACQRLGIACTGDRHQLVSAGRHRHVWLCVRHSVGGQANGGQLN